MFLEEKSDAFQHKDELDIACIECRALVALISKRQLYESLLVKIQSTTTSKFQKGVMTFLPEFPLFQELFL